MREQIAELRRADQSERPMDVADDEDPLRKETSAALEALLHAIWTNHLDEEQLAAQVITLQRLIDQGTPVTTALASESLAGTLPLLSRLLVRSMSASGAVRRALVTAMRAEGASIPAIARTFGVSHQRISNILQ